MKKILVIGSLNMDLVTNVKITPKVGETILGDGFLKIPGGKGANQAAAMGKLKSDVKMLGKVGNDGFGLELLNSLKSDGVDVENVGIVENTSTGIAMIMVNEDGDNSIVVVPGANFELRPSDITEELIKDCDIVVAQLETPIETIEKAFKMANQMGKITVLNPAPARVLSPELLANVSLLVPNETEFELLTGVNPITDELLFEGSKLLFERGVKALIVTLGKEGSMYIDEHIHKKISSYDVTAVDTTAAGDSFIGGVVAKIAEGLNVMDSIEFATKVAAITVGRIGAQTSLPSLIDVENFKGYKKRG